MSSTKGELKHLGFVRIAAIHAAVLISSLYDYIKNNSGPLRSIVGSVETAAKSVTEPLHEKFKNLPFDLLIFADQKVDEAIHKFDNHAPTVAKQVAHYVHMVLSVAAEKGGNMLSETKTGGACAGLHYAISELKHGSISLIAITYVTVDQFKPLHALADVMVPAAAYWAEKYNKLVISLTRKGHKMFSYFPQIPTDEISQACNKQKASKAHNGSAQLEEKVSSSSSDSE